MKNLVALVASSLLLMWMSCSSAKKEGKPSVVFEFPTTMPDSVKAQNTILGNKGVALYKVSCAKCHSTVVNGVEQIPDFAPSQLENYELRFSNPKHDTDLTEAKLTQEELRCVITYLEYRKKDSTRWK